MFGINNCPTFSQSEERVCAENPECTHQWSEWSQWSVGCPRLSFLFVLNCWLLVLVVLSLKAKVENRGVQKTISNFDPRTPWRSECTVTCGQGHLLKNRDCINLKTGEVHMGEGGDFFIKSRKKPNLTNKLNHFNFWTYSKFQSMVHVTPHISKNLN